MKLLTLAVAIALLGIFGCDEPNQMMQQVTRETGEIGEAPPTTGNIWLRETDCFEANPGYCHAGVSYTNRLGDADNTGHINTGQLTIYFEIPEVIRGNAYNVVLRYDPDRLKTDIQGGQTITIAETETDLVVRKDATATFTLRRGETIRFNYEVLDEFFAFIEIWDDFYLSDDDYAEPIVEDADRPGRFGTAIYTGAIELERADSDFAADPPPDRE